MKKYFSGFTIAISLLISSTSIAAKLDPLWQISKQLQTHSISSSKSYQATDIFIDVFIKSTDTTLTTEKITNIGGKVRSIVGPIMTASIPSKDIEEVSEWLDVEYVEAAKPMKPQNDLASADTGVTTVHAGTSLPHGYDGTGVIVGVIDSGIDLTHPAFKDETGESRVLYIWDQTDTSGTGPSEISSTYGTEYKHSAIIAGTTPHIDTSGHGTHVAGTAAGRDTTYMGIAPNADLIIVSYTVEYDLLKASITTTVCDAANYIFKKAAYLNRPAVINISLGNQYGPHDGTSLFDQCLDGLVSESAGRAIVAAAGNANSLGFLGSDNIGAHAAFAVENSKPHGSAFRAMSNRYPFPYVAEIWENAGCNTELQFGLWQDGVGLINWSSWVALGGDVGDFFGVMPYEINRLETNSALNGKNHSYVAVYPDALFDPFSYYFDIVFRGTCDHLDAWVESDKYLAFMALNGDIGGIEYHHGDTISTVGQPATAANVIAVGAHVTRTSWVDSTGGSHSDPFGMLDVIGELAYFSSRGPALNSAQGQKPNVTGPGAYIISAYSSNTASPDATRLVDSSHTIMEGTSMASPHVTGVVALLLQAYPSLSYTDIMSYLQNTARADSFVGTAPNSDWGYGKVDAAAAVTAVTAAYPPGVGDGDFSGITITGLSDAGSVSNDTKEFTVNFPRAALGSTCTTNNIFIAPVSGASASITKASWDSAVCNVASALPASTSVDSTTSLRLILNNPIGEGNFVFCISPSVRDSEEIKFGGKTVEFAAVSSGGDGGGDDGGGGGCALTQSSRPFSAMGIVLMFATLAAVALLRRLDNPNSGII